MTNPRKTSPAHTPGPWNLAPRYDKNGMIVSDDGDICQVNDDVSSSEAELANACLIAAAPDLLRAVETAAEYFEEASIDDDNALPYLKQMQHAIAEARGEAETIDG